MISSDIVRGHLDSIILRLIYEKDRYGYEMSKEISLRTNNEFQIKEASLYAVFQRLEKKGIIESYLGDISHGGKKKVLPDYDLRKSILSRANRRMEGNKKNNRYLYGGIRIMKEIDNYVDELFKNVPRSRQKENIVKDIKQNLEEKVLDLMSEGKSEEDAINKSIEEFGDIEDIKIELDNDQTHKGELARTKLHFSIWGSILFIALFIFINFYYTPHVIWAVYPIFVVLWWPLIMVYRWFNSKQ